MICISAYMSSVFPNDINYFIFKNIQRRVISVSWKNIREGKVLELVLLNCLKLVFRKSERF